jgi:cbb3-type cytochrome oxidase maturation protein
MSALYVVLPLALIIAGSAVLAFVWVVRSGQLDDVDTPPRRILFDDEIAHSAPASCARAHRATAESEMRRMSKPTPDTAGM